MKYDCDIIRDLIPMYHDKIASEKSAAAVEEHLKKCSECQKYHQSLKEPVELERQREEAREEGEQAYQAVAKKVRKKRRIVFAVLAAVVLSVFLIGRCIPIPAGTGLTSSAAVKSIQLIDDSSRLMVKETVGSFDVYVYENEDSYHTVAARYQFPLWHVEHQSSCSKFSEDSIALLGRISMMMTKDGNTYKLTFLAVQNNDPLVSYIEIGPEGDRIRKDAPLGEILTFSWDDQTYRWNDENAVAYSKEGTPLYKLGYDKVGNTIIQDNYHWIPAAE